MSLAERDSVKSANWLLPVAISSSVPLILVLILTSFPVLGEYSVFDGRSRAFLPFGLHQPLPNLVKTFYISTSVVFWGPGVFLFRKSLMVSLDRVQITFSLTWFATACLYFILPLMVTVWTFAFMGGHIPAGPWGVNEGNHGSWRYLYSLRNVLWNIFLLPVISCLLSTIAWLIRPAWRSADIVIMSFLAFYLLGWSHYWLID